MHKQHPTWPSYVQGFFLLPMAVLWFRFAYYAYRTQLSMKLYEQYPPEQVTTILQSTSTGNVLGLVASIVVSAVAGPHAAAALGAVLVAGGFLLPASVPASMLLGFGAAFVTVGAMTAAVLSAPSDRPGLRLAAGCLIYAGVNVGAGAAGIVSDLVFEYGLGSVPMIGAATAAFITFLAATVLWWVGPQVRQDGPRVARIGLGVVGGVGLMVSSAAFTVVPMDVWLAGPAMLNPAIVVLCTLGCALVYGILDVVGIRVRAAWLGGLGLAAVGAMALAGHVAPSPLAVTVLFSIAEAVAYPVLYVLAASVLPWRAAAVVPAMAYAINHVWHAAMSPTPTWAWVVAAVSLVVGIGVAVGGTLLEGRALPDAPAGADTASSS